MIKSNYMNVDVDVTNEETTVDHRPTCLEHINDKYHKSISYAYIIIVISTMIGLIAFTLTTDIEADNMFWLNQVIKYFSIALIQLFCGLLVTYRNLKVNYSRKIVHISYFMVPQLLDTEIIVFNKNTLTELWNVLIIFTLLIFILEIVRNKSSLLKIMFSAIDRPEDRPWTTFWFISQLCMSIPIIACFSILFNRLDKNHYIFIPLIILAFGDGLAEPIGTRFGYHKYTVSGFCVNNKYTRSVQGSMCVAFFSLLSILIYYEDFNKASITFSLVSLPILLTFVEAKSPHTWDNPIILLTGYTLLVGAYYIGQENS